MNLSNLKWVARILVAFIAVLFCCYVFDLMIEHSFSVSMFLIATVCAVLFLVGVFEFLIVNPLIKWTNNQKISILRKKEDDYEGHYAPETKPELPGGSKVKRKNFYNKSNVRKSKTTKVTNKKK